MNRLWTKNYTIITIGSVVSMLGNSMAGFAMSLFVLDYTQSPLYYAIYMFLYTLPQIAAPVLAGPSSLYLLPGCNETEIFRLIYSSSGKLFKC